MKKVDLEKYKSLWKNERGFSARKLSEKEISKFMKISSKSIGETFRKGLLLDIGIKTLLLISLVILFFLISNQHISLFINLIITLAVVTGLIWQFIVLRKIPGNKAENHNLINKLKAYIGFYYKYYIRSVLVSALSGTLFFIIGSMYYLLFKYNAIPDFQTDDFIVMTAGILLSFGLGAIVQLRYNNFLINQLEESLTEIEENTFNESAMIKLKNSRKKRTLIFGVALIAGLLLFLFIILKTGS